MPICKLKQFHSSKCPGIGLVYIRPVSVVLKTGWVIEIETAADLLSLNSVIMTYSEH